jgi:hypothetical protein
VVAARRQAEAEAAELTGHVRRVLLRQRAKLCAAWGWTLVSAWGFLACMMLLSALLPSPPRARPGKC